MLIECDLDGFHRLPVERLCSTVGSAPEELNQRFIQYSCPSLAHFIALLCRPTAACIPAGTNLILVDSLSALINHTFPKTLDTRTGTNGKGGNKGVILPLQSPQVSLSTVYGN